MISKKTLEYSYRYIKELSNSNIGEDNRNKLEYIKEVISESDLLTKMLASDIVKVYRKETIEHQRALRVLEE